MFNDMGTRRVFQVGGWVVSSVMSGTLVGACASSGTEPHAMTADQHQAAAASEEKAAAGHAAQYDPKATDRRGASLGSYAACTSYLTSNCYVPWQSTANPTARHREDSIRHQKVAENHRRASQAVREAEQRFCSGIPAADRDTSPFYHREDITVVETTKAEPIYGGTGSPNGARVTFRAVPGLSGEWLQRVVDCHLARNAVVGSSDSTMSYCPLAVPHATASVVSTRGGFAVEITSDDPGSVLEIIKRCKALSSGS
jgi:hypothetical protein